MDTLRVWCLCSAVWLALSGCANTSTDPREGGLLGGITGLQSGAYEQRIAEREQRLAELRATQEALHDESVWLDAWQESVTAEVLHERERLDALRQDLSQLEQRVNTLSREQAQSDQRIQALQERLAALRQQLDTHHSHLQGYQEPTPSHTGAALIPAGYNPEADEDVPDAEADERWQALQAQRRALQQEYESLIELSLQLAL